MKKINGASQDVTTIVSAGHDGRIQLLAALYESKEVCMEGCS